MARPVQEKIPPRYFSLAAIAAGALIGGWLLWAGAEEPRTYTVAMTISHHDGGYGVSVSCQACHVPVDAFSTQLGCFTGACHGELHRDTPYEEAIAMATQMMLEFPDAEERAQHYVDSHLRFSGSTCWECHKEHEEYEAEWPPSYYHEEEAASAFRELGYTSIVAALPERGD